jgi:2-oxoglutarate ferredoxin oxidoreductase subunit alpha
MTEKLNKNKEARLMKGNEALAEAAIRVGIQAYFGYPITPQSEILEYFTREMPKHNRVVLQAESELAAINMVYGAAAAGARVMTSSSSPGISLMQEGLSYIASAQLPCLVVNINRGGPGLGTIQPSQGDYWQAVKGGGHGDYHLIVLAPSSVQEMADFVFEAVRLAEKYRNPALILADGALGQMMEKVFLPEAGSLPLVEKKWATTGKPKSRERNIATSLFIQPEKMEQINLGLQAKYTELKKEVKSEFFGEDNPEILLVAYGLAARICQKTVELAAEKGIKVSLLRPITLYPFPSIEIAKLSEKTEAVLTVEMNAGQMVQDVALAVNGKCPVYHAGRMGGMISSPEEILFEIESILEKQSITEA